MNEVVNQHSKLETKNRAYIFTGIDGCGKLYTALELAKKELCLEKDFEGNYCGICNNCERISKDIHPNVITIQTPAEKKEIPIEAIRDLIKTLIFSPAEAGKRLVIIKNAHQLNKSSSNALLKTLEEPPANTTFILTTSNLNNIIGTIISRSQIVKFPPLKNKDIAKILKISQTHPILDYCGGSVWRAEFFISKEEEITHLIDFVSNPKKSGSHVWRLADALNTAINNDISSFEAIYSLIIDIIVKRIENEVSVKSGLQTISEIKKLAKKVYQNTQMISVIEAILLEVANENR